MVNFFKKIKKIVSFKKIKKILSSKDDNPKRGSILYRLVFTTFILAQSLSFIISFLGVALFLSETPANVTISDAIYNLLPRTFYKLELNNVVRLKSAGVNIEVINKLSETSLQYKRFEDETTFQNFIITELNNIKPPPNEYWVLNSFFKNLTGAIELNDENKYVLTYEVLNYNSFDYDNIVSVFLDKIDLSKNDISVLSLSQVLSHCINIPFEDRRGLKNEIVKSGNEQVIKILLDCIVAQSLVKQRPSLFILFISFFIASFSVILISVPLRLYQNEGLPPLPYIPILILSFIVGFFISGSSGFVITWTKNNHEAYIAKVNEYNNLHIKTNINKIQQKALSQYAINKCEENIISKKKLLTKKTNDYSLFIDWYEKTIYTYIELISILEPKPSKPGDAEPIIGSHEQKENFNSFYKNFELTTSQGMGEWQKIVMRVNRLLDLAKEEIEKKKRPGYGVNARTHLKNLGQYLIQKAKDNCYNIFNEIPKNINTIKKNVTQKEYCDLDDLLNELNILDLRRKGPLRDFTQDLSNSLNPIIAHMKSMIKEFSKYIDQIEIECKETSIDTSIHIEFKSKILPLIDYYEKLIIQTPNWDRKNKLIVELIQDLKKNISGFSFNYNQYDSDETLYKLVLSQLLTFLPYAPTYHIPVRFFEFIPNDKDGKIQSEIMKMSYGIYFSKESFLEELENNLNRVFPPCDRYKFLGIIQKKSNSYVISNDAFSVLSRNLFKEYKPIIPSHNDILFWSTKMDKNFSTSKKKSVIYSNDHMSTSVKQKLINELEFGMKRNLSTEENIILNGLIQKKSFNIEDDIFPILVANISDLSSVILTILLRLILSDWSQMTIFSYIERLSNLIKQIFGIFISPGSNIRKAFYTVGESLMRKLQNMFSDEKTKVKIEEEIKSAQMMNDIIKMKSGIWSEIKDSEKIKNLTKNALIREFHMASSIVPADEYKTSAKVIKELNTSIKEMLQDNKEIRKQYNNDIKELTQHVMEAKSIKRYTNELIDEMQMNFDERIRKNLKSEFQARLNILDVEHEAYQEKVHEFMTKYKHELSVELKKINSYKYYGMIDQLDNISKEKFNQLIQKMNDLAKELVWDKAL